MERTRALRLFAGCVVCVACVATLSVGGCPGGSTGLPFNLPPSVSLSSDVTRGVAPLTVRFSSDQSSDDGLIVSRVWNFADGGTSQEISPTHTFTTTGTFAVTLTVTDDGGLSTVRTVNIVVTQAPVARITVDRTNADSPPALFNFSAAGSFDPDGEIRQYQFDFGDGTREFLQTVPHTYATSGTFRATLTVTDNAGVTGTTSVLIQIGINNPTIEVRVPPPSEKNVVVSNLSPLWVQAQINADPAAPHTVRVGLDGDRDQCEAQADSFTVASGEIVRRFTGHDDRVNDIALSPNGLALATVSDDGTAKLYDTASGALLRTISGTGNLTCVAYAPDGGSIAFGQSNGAILQIKLSDGSTMRTYASHTNAVRDVQFSPDGSQLFSGGLDRRAILWSTNDGTILRDFAHTLAVNGVAFNPSDATMVATACADNNVRLFNTTGGGELATLSSHTEPVNAVAFNKGGDTLFSAADDDTAKSWTSATGALVATFSGHTGNVLSLLVTPDDASLITGSADGDVRVWSIASAMSTRTVEPCASPIPGLAISSDGVTGYAAIAAKNDIQLDTFDPSGNDVDVAFPAAFSLRQVASLAGADVPEGPYAVWVEVDTDRTDPQRAYAIPIVSVIPTFTAAIGTDTPQIPLVDDEASVVVEQRLRRQIFDLGSLEQGDRIFISLMRTPGFSRVFTSDTDYSLAILDGDGKIFAWYQRTIHFNEHTKLIVGHPSAHYYVATDGAQSVHVRIQRGTNLFQPRQQRVLVSFAGSPRASAGPFPAQPVRTFSATNLNPAWGAAETTAIKTAILTRLNGVYLPYNVEFFSSDDTPPPNLPSMTVHMGETNLFAYGVADHIDPRNDTLTGTAIVYATSIFNDFGGGLSAADVGTLIGTITSHEVGHLLGLRHVNEAVDLMFTGADPTNPLTIRTDSTVSTAEQVWNQPSIGIQDADLLLRETVGPR